MDKLLDEIQGIQDFGFLFIFYVFYLKKYIYILHIQEHHLTEDSLNDLSIKVSNLLCSFLS